MPAFPTLRQLRHFVSLVQCRHFGHAAQQCHVTQSTLSASIKEFETLLGRQLIERTRRSVIVTPLGQEVSKRAAVILRQTEDLVEQVTAASQPLSGPLRLGVIPTIAPYMVPRALPALRAAYPRLRLYLREDQSAPLLDRYSAGELDLLLLALPYPLPGMVTCKILDDPFFVAFPAGHRFAKRKRLRADDLIDEDLLLLEDGHCLREHAASACRIRPNEQHREAFQATSLNTLVHMVDNGLGLTLLPGLALDAGIVRGTGILVRPLVGDHTSRQIGLAWRASSSRGPEFRLFGEELKKQMQAASK